MGVDQVRLDEMANAEAAPKKGNALPASVVTISTPTGTGSCCGSCGRGAPSLKPSRPNRRRVSRRQLVAVGLCLADAGVFASLLAPLLPDGVLQFALPTAFAVCFFVMAVVGIRTMTVNPSDSCQKTPPKLGEGKKLYCRHCQAYVNVGSKHCWDCGTCCAKFDHHCAWLNTCIGGKNYTSFFMTICCFLVYLGLMISTTTYLLVERILDNQFGGIEENVTNAALLVVLAINVPAICLDLTLLSFHTYLCVKRMTTYEFLKKRAARIELKKKTKEAEKTAGKTQVQAWSGGDSTVLKRSNASAPLTTPKAYGWPQRMFLRSLALSWGHISFDHVNVNVTVSKPQDGDSAGQV